MRPHSLPALLILAATLASPARSFCGFYVAHGDAKLWNHSSQVVLVRDEDRTVLTMASDYRGEASDFALVVPVPTVLQRGQIHVTEAPVIAHLDKFSEPRLVEYFDEDPCAIRESARLEALGMAKNRGGSPPASMAMDAMGVRIEARYAVGEYDILILSAAESAGLERWLIANGYRIPAGAARVLNAYLQQGMKFFVAKVNLKEQARLGLAQLRPIQIAFESPRFMLPIRLGMANADGPQDLFVYAITKVGRVETTNYRNARLSTGTDVPEYVSGDFTALARAAFAQQHRREGPGVVFTEYAWDMTWCDPCASQPLSPEELQQAGVWWVSETGGATPVFLTRLHARYDRTTFPEDLSLQVTSDRQNFQTRYVIHHEWQGDASCEAARVYRRGLPARRQKTAEGLAALTGWRLERIRGRMALGIDWTKPGEAAVRPEPTWWQRLGWK
jgi:hypothetical protein